MAHPSDPTPIRTFSHLEPGYCPAFLDNGDPTIADEAHPEPLISGMSFAKALSSEQTALRQSAGTDRADTAPGTVTPGAPTAGPTLCVGGVQSAPKHPIPNLGSPAAPLACGWSGFHIIDQCVATGALQDLSRAACGAKAEPTILMFEARLKQYGDSVTGNVNLGGLTGPVNGTFDSGVLTLRGLATSASGFNAVITSWTTRITSGGALIGHFGYRLTFKGSAGMAAIVARVDQVPQF